MIKLRSKQKGSHEIIERRKSSNPSKEQGYGIRPRQAEPKQAPSNASSFLPPIKEINNIIRGSYIGWDTISEQRSNARTTRNPIHKVFWIRGNRKPASLPSTFDNNNEHGVKYPYCNALVVLALIVDNGLSCILLDNGSSINILFGSVFDQMQG